MKNSTRRHEFKDLLATAQISPLLRQIEPYVEFDPVQPPGAISATLALHNRNDQSLEIPNPIDYINYALQDERGFPLDTPAVVSRVKLPAADWEAWENEFFKPIAVSLGQDTLPLSDEKKKKTIALPEAETYKITFQLSGLKGPGQAQGDSVVPIPPGTYTLTLTYSLRLRHGPDDQNRLLQSEGLSIQLRDKDELSAG
jgi:hypothetical protein